MAADIERIIAKAVDLARTPGVNPDFMTTELLDVAGGDREALAEAHRGVLQLLESRGDDSELGRARDLLAAAISGGRLRDRRQPGL